MHAKSLMVLASAAMLLLAPLSAKAQLSAFATGPGANPGAALAFLAAPAQITVANFNTERIFVVSDKSFGTNVGAAGLDLFICFQRQGGALTPVGVGALDQQIDAGFRQLFGLNAVIRVNQNGNYRVGLCGFSPTFPDWNSNDGSYTSALIVN